LAAVRQSPGLDGCAHDSGRRREHRRDLQLLP
jgi:hypothetical protein